MKFTATVEAGKPGYIVADEITLPWTKVSTLVKVLCEIRIAAIQNLFLYIFDLHQISTFDPKINKTVVLYVKREAFNSCIANSLYGKYCTSFTDLFHPNKHQDAFHRLRDEAAKTVKACKLEPGQHSIAEFVEQIARPTFEKRMAEIRLEPVSPLNAELAIILTLAVDEQNLVTLLQRQNVTWTGTKVYQLSNGHFIVLRKEKDTDPIDVQYEENFQQWKGTSYPASTI